MYVVSKGGLTGVVTYISEIVMITIGYVSGKLAKFFFQKVADLILNSILHFIVL